MQILKTTEEYGGINKILERRYDQKQYQCEQCDFRANDRHNIWEHKRRNHSYYKVLCDTCGYTTNHSSHLKRHIRAKHPEYMM